MPCGSESLKRKRNKMMGKRRLNGWRVFLLLAIGCYFSISVFAQTEIDNFNNYSDVMATLGVRFIPPYGWRETKAEFTNEDGMGIFLVPAQGRAVINIIWNKRFGSDEKSFLSGLDEYRKFSRTYSASKIISEEEIILFDVPCYVFVIELNLTTGKKKIKDYVFFKNGKAYNVTYTAPIEEFNAYLPIFEEMLNTFELVNNTPVVK